MSMWEALSWVLWAACASALLSVIFVFVLGVVAYVRDRRGEGTADDPGPAGTWVKPWRPRGGDLSRLHPTRAVVLVWAQRPTPEELEVHDVAHAAVRAAMPQLAEQLDRMVADARAHAVAGVPTPVGPCAYGSHVWAGHPVDGVVQCSVCGSLSGVA